MKIIGFAWHSMALNTFLERQAEQVALIEGVAARIGGELQGIHVQQDITRHSKWEALDNAVHDTQIAKEQDGKSLLIVSTLHGRNSSVSRNLKFLEPLTYGIDFVIGDTVQQTITDLEFGKVKPLSQTEIQDLLPFLTLASAAATAKAIDAAKAWISEESARRTLDMQKRKERGEKIGAQNPTADNLTDDARQRGANKTKENAREANAEITDLIHNLRNDGLSFRDIASQLNELGRKTRTGKKWNHVQVHKLFHRGEGE